MADDKTKRDRRNEDYEIAYLAQRHNITKDQVIQLIKEHGNQLVKLEEAAKNLKRSS